MFCPFKVNTDCFFLWENLWTKAYFLIVLKSKDGTKRNINFLPSFFTVNKCKINHLGNKRGWYYIRYHSPRLGCRLLQQYTNNHLLLLSERTRNGCDDSSTTSWEASPPVTAPLPLHHWFALLTQMMVIMDVIHINGKIKQQKGTFCIYISNSQVQSFNPLHVLAGKRWMKALFPFKNNFSPLRSWSNTISDVCSFSTYFTHSKLYRANNKR